MFKVPKVTLRGSQVRTFWSNWEPKSRKLVFTPAAKTQNVQPHPPSVPGASPPSLFHPSFASRPKSGTRGQTRKEDQAVESRPETPIRPAALSGPGLGRSHREVLHLHSQVPEQKRRTLSGLNTAQKRSAEEAEEKLASISSSRLLFFKV